MTSELRQFLAAIRLYTRLPVRGRLADIAGPPLPWPGHGVRYFPLAGVVVGLLQAAVYMIASIVLPHSVSLVLALAAGILMTGGTHERGWAAFCRTYSAVRAGADAGAAGAPPRQTPEAPLRELAALAVALLLLLRLETLASIEPDWIVASLVCAAAFSRGCAVLMTVGLHHSRDEPGGGDASSTDVALAMAVAVLPSLVLTLWTGDPLPAAFALGMALLAAATMRRIIRTRTRTYTANSLGAVQQVTEAAFLLGLLMALGGVTDEAVPDPAS